MNLRIIFSFDWMVTVTGRQHPRHVIRSQDAASARGGTGQMHVKENVSNDNYHKEK